MKNNNKKQLYVCSTLNGACDKNPLLSNFILFRSSSSIFFFFKSINQIINSNLRTLKVYTFLI